MIYLLLYVDDILIASVNKSEIVKLKEQLNSEFEMKDLGEDKRILEGSSGKEAGANSRCIY